MSGKLSPFPARSGSYLTAGDTVCHSFRPHSPGLSSFLGKVEWGDVSGPPQKSPFSLVSPLLCAPEGPALSPARGSPPRPLLLQSVSRTVCLALSGTGGSALSKTEKSPCP